MQINLVYDSSVGSAPEAFKTAMTTAANYLDNLFTDPITINIAVGWGEYAGTPVAANFGSGGPASVSQFFSYSVVRNALIAHATTPAEAIAALNLPSTDPTNGGSFYVAPAQEKTLGLIPANNPGIDGYVGFGISSSYAFDQSNIGSNQLDFVALAEH
jgi:hypothetical protein